MSIKGIFRELGDCFFGDRVQEQRNEYKGISDTVGGLASHPDVNPSYNIRVWPAKGGQVIELRKTYDSNKTSTYRGPEVDMLIVADGEDLVEKLGHAMMLHTLTR